MPTVATKSSFAAFDFTEEEYIVAVTLNDLQYKHLQTERAIAAEQKVLLQYDGEKPHLVVAQEAYLRGQIDLLSHLLSLSDNRQLALVNLAKKQQEAQSTEGGKSSNEIFNSDTNQ